MASCPGRPAASTTWATFPAGKDEVRLPLETNGAHIVLPVSVNGSEPVPVVLDTGMPMPGIFMYGGEHVDAMDLEFSGMKAQIGGAGGTHADVEGGRLGVRDHLGCALDQLGIR